MKQTVIGVVGERADAIMNAITREFDDAVLVDFRDLRAGTFSKEARFVIVRGILESGDAVAFRLHDGYLMRVYSRTFTTQEVDNDPLHPDHSCFVDDRVSDVGAAHAVVRDALRRF